MIYDIDQHRELRKEYLSGRKRSGQEGKLLRLEEGEYTPEQREEIKTTRIAMKHAMWKARETRAGWHSMLKETVSTPVTPLAIARVVKKARMARRDAREAVREAEVDYRLAVEMPFLLREQGRRSAKRLPFRPYTPDVEFRPIGSLLKPEKPEKPEKVYDLRSLAKTAP